MAKSNYLSRYSYWILIVVGFSAHGQTVNKKDFPSKPVVTNEAELRRAILDTGKTQLKLREKAGVANNNKHPQISIYNRAVGVPDNAFYCASGGYWCHLKAGVRLPISAPAAVRSWFSDPKKHVKWRQGEKVQVFDAVSMFKSHVEFVADTQGFDDEDEDFVQTIGWNTTGPGKTAQGCHINYRHKDWIKAIANHITPYLKNGNPTKLPN